MGFHYGFEKKKFDADWKILRKEYESAGMSDESIQAMYEFDWGVFNRRRADENKEQAFTSAMYDCETLGSEDQSTLYHKFLEELSWHDEYSFGTGRFAWIESIDDSMLYQRLCCLEDTDKEILTLLAFEGYSKREIASNLGITEQAIGKRIKKLKKLLFMV